MAGQVVEPWHLWREVWSWGGPDTVSRYKVTQHAGGRQQAFCIECEQVAIAQQRIVNIGSTKLGSGLLLSGNYPIQQSTFHQAALEMFLKEFSSTSAAVPSTRGPAVGGPESHILQQW
jgi:hypothetical protein